MKGILSTLLVLALVIVFGVNIYDNAGVIISNITGVLTSATASATAGLSSTTTVPTAVTTTKTTEWNQARLKSEHVTVGSDGRLRTKNGRILGAAETEWYKASATIAKPTAAKPKPTAAKATAVTPKPISTPKPATATVSKPAPVTTSQGASPQGASPQRTATYTNDGSVGENIEYFLSAHKVKLTSTKRPSQKVVLDVTLVCRSNQHTYGEPLPDGDFQYDCDDFAADAVKELRKMGYQAIMVYTSKHMCAAVREGDVYYCFEPQFKDPFNNDEGYLPGGTKLNMYAGLAEYVFYR